MQSIWMTVLQTTQIDAARINGNELELKYFLMGTYYIRKYPRETDVEYKFDYSMSWG